MRTVRSLLVFCGLLFASGLLSAQTRFDDCPIFPDYCIVTGSPEFTYHKIGESLAQIVARSVNLPLQVLEGGSIENVQRMRYQNGVKMAIVQSDVILHYKKMAQSNPQAADLIRPLRVMLPLYPEEIHILVRANSPIRSLRDLRDQKIAVGPRSSGSGLTIVSLYEYLFGESPSNIVFHESHDAALRAVMIEKSADVWVMTVGQGTERLQFPAAAAQAVRLVGFNRADPLERRVLDGPYYPGKIRAASYPWLSQDQDVVAVKAFLITQTYQRSQTKRNIEKLATALCTQFGRLQREHLDIWRDDRGQPIAIKWRDVALELSVLPGGWEYSDDVLRGFANPACGITSTAGWSVAPSEPRSRATPSTQCSSQELLLGFCK